MLKYAFSLCVVAFLISFPRAIEAKYPDGPITIIVPSRAGGSTEVTANLFIKYAKKYWPEAEFKVKVVPENSGQKGFEELAMAEPDGQTIGIIFTTQIITHIIAKQAKYSLESFYYLGRIESDPEIIVLPRSSPVDNLTDLAKLARQKKLSAAINGFGSDDFISIKKYENIAGVSLKIIPTKTSAEQRTAVMNGQVDMSFMNLSQVYPQHKYGQVKIIAVFSKERSNLVPEVPTGEEEGFPIYMEFTRGMVAPSKISPEIQKKLKSLFHSVIADPDFINDCKKVNIFLGIMSGKEYYKYLKKLQKTIQKLYNKSPW